MMVARFLLLGVAIGVALTDQSDTRLPGEEQIEQTAQGKGRLDAPAVVLQLKYDRGELDRIYLAQFRKGSGVWTPSVEARSDLCTDLCHAGLGGEACGSSCEDLMPVGLKQALNNASHSTAVTTGLYGEPRVDVCPSLCEYQLGQPLCMCEAGAESEPVDWSAICTSFCRADNYVLRGCPACEETSASQFAQLRSSQTRTLSTAEGWTMWCNAQCRQGHGGAACNCDRAPL